MIESIRGDAGVLAALPAVVALDTAAMTLGSRNSRNTMIPTPTGQYRHHDPQQQAGAHDFGIEEGRQVHAGAQGKAKEGDRQNPAGLEKARMSLKEKRRGPRPSHFLGRAT